MRNSVWSSDLCSSYLSPGRSVPHDAACVASRGLPELRLEGIVVGRQLIVESDAALKGAAQYVGRKGPDIHREAAGDEGQEGDAQDSDDRRPAAGFAHIHRFTGLP